MYLDGEAIVLRHFCHQNKTVLDSLAEQGVHEVIRKPFEAALLRRVIEQALRAGV